MDQSADESPNAVETQTVAARGLSRNEQSKTEYPRTQKCNWRHIHNSFAAGDLFAKSNASRICKTTIHLSAVRQGQETVLQIPLLPRIAQTLCRQGPPHFHPGLVQKANEKLTVPHFHVKLQW